MKIFGELWDAPVCEDAAQAETPVGEKCAWCEVAIKEGDQGQLIPCGLADGSVSELPWHKECFLRSIFGAPEHIEGRCSCHGGQDSVPKTPEEKRAEAIEVWRMKTGK